MHEFDTPYVILGVLGLLCLSCAVALWVWAPLWVAIYGSFAIGVPGVIMLTMAVWSR